ncbi:MAG TPA: SBBP repeat-containing protein [Blastocatellia bacterium]|nr:SBBP repeat-containing protein [Blastocatellia bacterium]
MRNTLSGSKAVVCLAVSFFALMGLLPSRPGSTGARVAASAAGDSRVGPGRSGEEIEDRVRDSYGKLPLMFEANVGQADSKVDFLSRGAGYSVFISSTEAVFAMSHSSASDDSDAGKKASLLRMRLVGASPHARPEGLELMEGTSNYFVGGDEKKWRTAIPNYGRVLYRQVYAGIDVSYYGNQRELEYDFIVAPGASSKAIRLEFKGARRMRVDEAGDLLLGTAAGEMRQRRPVAYQEVDGARRSVEARYVIRGRNKVSLKVGAYDASRPLVIDPVFSYSTFLGGVAEETARGIRLDSDGNAYVTGRTRSAGFPKTVGSFDPTYNEGADIFVTKLNADGSGLIYSTFIGGARDEEGFGIALDPSNNAYVTGFTRSNDFPTTPGAFQPQPSLNVDTEAFAIKLNSAGSALVYSTYLGGDGTDQGNGIAVDAEGFAYVTGATASLNFDTTPGAFQNTIEGNVAFGDAFITRLNQGGTGLMYSTYLGGTNFDTALGIDVDAAGLAYVAGTTRSVDFDTTPGAFQTTFITDGGFNFSDAFVTKVNSNGTGLIYSTYVGDIGEETARGIHVNSAGEAYVVGNSDSQRFPTTPGALRVANKGVVGSANGGAGWSSLNAEMPDLSIQTTFINTVVIDPSTPSTIYAATSETGVFKSTNGGGSWAAMNSGLPEEDLRTLSLAIDPSAPSTLYVGTHFRGVFKTTDGGASWQEINNGQTDPRIFEVAVDPSTPSTIYNGSEFGVFKSTDAGAHWARINSGLSISLSVSVFIDPSNPSTVYGGAGSNGIIKSTDGGATWRETGIPDDFLDSMAIHPVTGTLFASNGAGLIKSTDGAATWSAVDSDLTRRTISHLAIQPSDPSIMYAGTINGVIKSTDGGDTWSEANAGLIGSWVRTVSIDPVNSSTVYAGLNDGNVDAFALKLNAGGTALVYSTLLGGAGNEQAHAVDVDSSGNAYVAGAAFSSTFPVTRGLSPFRGGFTDAFVSKLNPSASALVYSTCVGGPRQDTAFAVAVDSAESCHVVGTSSSPEFPTTPGAFQPVIAGTPPGGSADAFISKLQPEPVLRTDLSVTMTGPAESIAGHGVVHTIKVTNDGDEDAVSIVVSTDMPPSLILSSCEGDSCTEVLNDVRFDIPFLAPGQSADFSFTSSIACNVQFPATITSTARVSSLSIDPNAANDSASFTFTATTPPGFIDPSEFTIPSEGGSSGFVVINGSGCAWNAVSNVDWITIIDGTGCCDSGGVSYRVDLNPGPPRVGTISVVGRTFTVHQEAGFSAGGFIGVPVNIGILGIPGVTVTFTRVSGTGALPAPVTTNAFGNWSQTGFEFGTTYRATPAKRRFTFAPTSTDFSAREMGIDFTGSKNADTAGVFRPSDGSLFLKNTNGTGFADTFLTYGIPGDYPVTGDWDGDGIDTIGVYRGGTFFLRNSNTNGFADVVAAFGLPGDQPVVGDWDGDGIDTIGVFREGVFLLRNSNTTGDPETVFVLGNPGDVGIAGDWDGDDIVTTGVFRPSNGALFLKNTNSTGFADIVLTYGLPGDKPVVGDWNRDGRDTIGVYRQGTFFLRNSNTNGFADIVFTLGVPEDHPIAGDWNGLP